MTMTNEMASLAGVDVTVKRGDTGDAVKTLQTLLNYRGAGLKIDSIFGAMTEVRVIEYQQAVKLVADGVVGPQTWNGVRTGTIVPRVSGSAIEMRANPDRAAAVVQTLESEERVKIINRSSLLADNYHWFEVETPEKTGWVREDLMQLHLPFTFPLPRQTDVAIQIPPRPWSSHINPEVEAGIRSVFELGTNDRVRYLHQPLDFNGSGTPGLMLAYPFICGIGGCTMLVMEETQSGYRVITKITNVQQPVIVNFQEANRYPTLIVYTGGSELPNAYRRLQFDGSSYPTDTLDAPILPGGTIVTDSVALASRITPETAAPLVAV